MNHWRWICLTEVLALGALWWWTMPADPVERNLASGPDNEFAPAPNPAELVPLPASAPQPAAAPALPPPAEASPLRAWTGAENRVVLMCEVRDEDGNRVRDLRGTYAHVLGSQGLLPTSRGDEGRFVLQGVEPGGLHFSLQALGMDAAEHSVVVSDAPPIQRCVLRMQSSARVNVRIVTGQGTSLFEWLATTGAPVIWYPDLELGREPSLGDRLAYQSRSFGNEYGTVVFPDGLEKVVLPLGVHAQLHLHADPPLYVTAWLGRLRLGDARIEAGVREVQIRVNEDELRQRFGSMRCRILDADSGLPLAGARAHVGYDWGGGLLALSDPDGRVSFPSLVPENMHLQVNLQNYSGIEQRIMIRTGSEIDLGELRLTRPGMIRALVVDAEGQAFASKGFSLLQASAGGVPQETIRAISRTSEEGRILLQAGREPFQIVLQDERHGLQAFTWERGSAETEERRIQLRPGVRTRLVFEGPVDQHRLLWLLDAEGRRLLPPFRPEEETTATYCLCPGLHLLRVEDLDRNFIATLDLMVPEGGGDLEVSLP